MNSHVPSTKFGIGSLSDNDLINSLESSAKGKKFEKATIFLFLHGDIRDFIVYDGSISYPSIKAFLDGHYQTILSRKRKESASTYSKAEPLSGSTGFDRDSSAKFFAIYLMRKNCDVSANEQIAELNKLAEEYQKDKMRVVYIANPAASTAQLSKFTDESGVPITKSDDIISGTLTTIVVVRPRQMRYHICTCGGGASGQLMQLCFERILSGEARWKQLDELPKF